MSRSSSLFASGRSRTPRTTLKIAAFAPMPSARVTMTVIARPLTLASDRAANLKSVMRFISAPSLIVYHRFGDRLAIQFSDWPDFDAAFACRRNFRRHLDRVVQVSRLDQVEAGQLLLRLRERAVGDRHLAVADAHCRRRLDRLERLRRHQDSAVPQSRPAGGALAVRHGVQLLWLEVDQAQILHVSPQHSLVEPVARKSTPGTPRCETIGGLR